MNAPAILGPIVFLVVTGCGGWSGSTADLLRDGSPQACITEDVQGLWRQKLLPEYPEDSFTQHNEQMRMLNFSMESATVSQVKAAEASMVCEAKLVIASKADPKLRTSQIARYEVRPVIGSPNEIVLVINGSEITNWAMLAADNIAPIEKDQLQ